MQRYRSIFFNDNPSGLTHQENITFVAGMHLTTEPQNVWNKPTNMKGEVDDSTIIVGVFDIILSIMYNTTRQKIMKYAT